MVHISDDTSAWVIGGLSYPLKVEVLENNHILTRPLVFLGGIWAVRTMMLPRGTFLPFSGEITKDQLRNVSG